MSIFQIKDLPDIDQQQIKRGLCPWCLEPLYDGMIAGMGEYDICSECGDRFSGNLTIDEAINK